MVSSKYLTAFSDFRLPRDAPDFVTPAVYVRYLNDYVDAFNLRSLIQCDTRIKKVTRSETGHVIHLSEKRSESRWECDAVAICTGINVHPRIPEIPGIERVPVVLHSSQLKTRKQLGNGTNVVVLGAGETGMDIAHLAVTAPAASVTVCHRDGFFCAPKVRYYPFQSLYILTP